jgi:hypothetical protein
MPRSETALLRLLAAEALATSAQMTDGDCKQTMVRLAASYERLADYAEKREAASSEADALVGRHRPPRP